MQDHSLYSKFDSWASHSSCAPVCLVCVLGCVQYTSLYVLRLACRMFICGRTCPLRMCVAADHKCGLCYLCRNKVAVTSPIDKAFGGPRHRAVFEWFQVRRASTMCCVRSVSVPLGLVCGLRSRGVLVSNVAENRPNTGPKIRIPRPETATNGHTPNRAQSSQSP